MKDSGWITVLLLLVSLNFGTDYLASQATQQDIATLEQTVAELQTKVEVLEEQQQQGLQAVLGCVGDEAVCFEQRQELNEHGLPGQAWVKAWCCPGPGKGGR